MKNFSEKEKQKIRLKLAKENLSVVDLCADLGCSRNAYYMALKDANRASKVATAILNWLYK